MDPHEASTATLAARVDRTVAHGVTRAAPRVNAAATADISRGYSRRRLDWMRWIDLCPGWRQLTLLLPVTLLVWILAAQDFATPAAAGSPPSDRWLAVAFAPLGAVLRYRLSKLNGKVLPHFPVGTFAANVAGSMIAAVLSIAASSLDANVSPARVAVLTAAGTGFTGSLSTVSTFANELDGLGTAPGADHPGGVGIAAGWRPYVYAAGSIVGVQAALLALHALNALAE